jgi:DNA repair protein RecO (recombination protein O)
MGAVETEAIVLRTYNLAEADKIVVCLTRCCGVVRGVANGARRLKSRFGAALEPFTFINLGYYEKDGRELVSIKQAEIERSYFSLTRTAEMVGWMAYLSELVIDFAPPHEPNKNLFRLVSKSLEAVADSPDQAPAIKRYFEIWLLKLSGFMPETRACTSCRKYFDATERSYTNTGNKLQCSACSHGRGIEMSAGTRHLLRVVLTHTPQEFAHQWPDFEEAARTEAGNLARHLIESALERRPRVSEGFLTQFGVQTIM